MCQFIKIRTFRREHIQIKMNTFLNKLLNQFLLVENLLGIYRNYCIQKKINKILIIAYILVLTLLHTVILYKDEHFLLGGKEFSRIKLMFGGFSVLSYANSVSAVVNGIYYSHVFTSYIKSISRISDYFQNNIHFNDFICTIKNIYRLSIATTVFCMAASLYRSSQILIHYFLMKEDKDMLTFVSVSVSQTFNRFTVIFEKVIMFFVIMVVVQLVKCLNSIIYDIHEKMRNCEISLEEQYKITKEHIQEWVEQYRDLANCCGKLSLGFGRQVYF